MKIKKLPTVRISVSMAIIGIVWIASGNGKVFLSVCLAVFLHELFHGLTALVLGLRVNEIVLYPFGGGIDIENIDSFNDKEVVIAFAGPLFSVLLGFLWQKGVSVHILPQWEDFVAYSYSIAIFNFLPVFPFDGGRIIRGILVLLLGKKGNKVSKITSLVFAVIFFAFCILRGVFYSNYSFGVIGAFAVISAIKSYFCSDFCFRKTTNSKNIRLIPAKKNEPMLNVYNRFSGESYCIAVIIDQKGKIEKMITEEEMLNRLMLDSTVKI